VRVEQVQSPGETSVLARLGDGSVFGEMSLLAGEPRSSTVVVEGCADLLRLGTASYSALIPELPQLAALLQRFGNERMVRNLLGTNPFFQAFEPDQRMSLLKRFEAHKVQAGTVLVRQDKQGRGLYLILHGEAVVVRAEPSGHRTELARLGAGDCFGEISLCQQCPTTATVTATWDSTIMFLPREYFQRLVEAVPALGQYYSELSNQRLNDLRRQVQTPRRPTNDDDLVRV